MKGSASLKIFSPEDVSVGQTERSKDLRADLIQEGET